MVVTINTIKVPHSTTTLPSRATVTLRKISTKHLNSNIIKEATLIGGTHHLRRPMGHSNSDMARRRATRSSTVIAPAGARRC